IAWVRLSAPDVALAEAAIGAGLTGALILDAVRQLGRNASPTARPPSQKMLQTARVTAGLIALAMVLAVWDLRFPLTGLLPAMEGHLADSGALHPMTAVLLTFRGWDTWLEIGVLLIAALSVLVIHRTGHPRDLPVLSAPP